MTNAHRLIALKHKYTHTHIYDLVVVIVIVAVAGCNVANSKSLSCILKSLNVALFINSGESVLYEQMCDESFFKLLRAPTKIKVSDFTEPFIYDFIIYLVLHSFLSILQNYILIIALICISFLCIQQSHFEHSSF